ncbi:MAG TPA: ABC transporter permease subunit, partial [Polyangia bacterium]
GLRQIPLLGLAPLISLWLGNGEAPKTLMVLLAVFFPIFVNSHDGVRALDRRMLEVARVCGLSRFAVLRRVVLPGIAPFFFTGLSQAVAFVWLATIGSELLFTAGSGLGTMMQTAQAAARMDVVLVCVVTIGLAGLSVNAVVRRLGSRVMRWRDLEVPA